MYAGHGESLSGGHRCSGSCELSAVESAVSDHVSVFLGHVSCQQLSQQCQSIFGA